MGDEKLSETLEKAKNNDSLLKSIIVLSALVLGSTGIVDISNINKTHEIVEKMQAAQEMYIKEMTKGDKTPGMVVRDIYEMLFQIIAKIEEIENSESLCVQQRGKK